MLVYQRVIGRNRSFLSNTSFGRFQSGGRFQPKFNSIFCNQKMVGRRNVCLSFVGKVSADFRVEKVALLVSGRAVLGESVTSTLQTPNVFNELESET